MVKITQRPKVQFVFAVLYIVSFGELKNLVTPSLMPPGNLTESYQNHQNHRQKDEAFKWEAIMNSNRTNNSGAIDHYDRYGRKVGESRPNGIGGYDHYDRLGRRVGETRQVFGGFEHYDRFGRSDGFSKSNGFGWNND